ncbi:MAG TPA: glycosyl transferase family 1 [Cyanothece sp. UBA12306]|nr:glycosyl transferase family 1 [Cyanothece sp. UBA12306]
MKVTFCAYDFPNRVGGPSSWLPRLLPGLKKRGIESKVLFLTTGEIEKCQSIQLVKQLGFEHKVQVWHTYTEQRVRWILEQLKEDPPDVFIPNLMVPAFYASRWLKKAGIPTIGVMHSDDDFHYGLLDQFVFGSPQYQLSGFVCVSHFLEQTVKKMGSTSTVIRCIPYGAPLPPSTTQKPPDNLRIAYVGSLKEEQKRISEVAKAFCRVVKEIPKTEAVFYGNGSASSTVEKIIAEQGENLPIELAGRIDSDKIQEYLLQCHVIVLLSDYEGLPIALMEAMACGVVPVCLRIRSGIPELIEDGVTGLLVDDRGDKFVEAIRRLREDLTLWEKLSQGTRGKIEAEYSSEVGADLWAKFIQELHENSQSHGKIKIPPFLSLPPIHSGLVREDQRYPSLVNRLRKKTSQIFNQIKTS